MERKIINFIEDKKIIVSDNWYYHATNNDIHTIMQILNEGIKSSYLRNEKSLGGYNGRYYISLAKANDKNNEIYLNFQNSLKFILDAIHPIKTSQKYFETLFNTILPFRYSDYAGEYHKFLKINSSKIIGLEYNLGYMLSQNVEFDIERLKFLRQLVICLDKIEKDIPIYDFSLNKEINKQKIKMLELE